MTEQIIYVYILRLANGEHYVGITSDLEKRVADHRQGRYRLTRRYLPIDFICCLAVTGMGKAKTIKKKIKSKGVEEYLSNIK